jgi:integrase
MKKKKNPRGLFERPPGSGVWWINYYVKGNQHREKVGRKSDAIDLYRVRKADATVGRKLPVLRNTRTVTISELIDDALEFVAHHKDRRNYISKAAIVRKDLGSKTAADLTPQELERWLRAHCKSAATSNRYKAFVSLCYREGMRNGKVNVNPARLVRQRKESVGRLRFLSYDEYDQLFKVISERFPEHLEEFIASVYTGMRLTEQYTTEWSQVHLDRRTIELTKTKNGYARTVHLNEEAVNAIKSIRPSKARPSDRVFPRERTQSRFDNRSWFLPCLEEAKITGAVWHSNRHTFCSWLAMEGATIKEIQEAAGHKTVTMAARYSHLSPAHKLTVVERIVRRGTKQAPAKIA